MYINPNVVFKNNSKSKDHFFCHICSFPLKTNNDFFYDKEYDCCYECYLTFAESRKDSWKEGWRPEKSIVEEYIYLRKSIYKKIDTNEE